MHRSKRIKKVIIITLLIIELCFVSLTVKTFCNKNLKEIKLEHKVDKKKFSMYVQNDTGGYDEYTESNLFPEDYNLNLEKSNCVDINGKIVNDSLTSNENSITIISNKTVYCYLYFDLIKDDVTIAINTDGESGVMPSSGAYTNSATCKNGSITWSDKYQRLEIGDLMKKGTKCNVTFTKDTNKTLLRDEVESEATTSSSTYGYRYSGTNPDNYIWFNNEMWRIIGSIPTCLSASCGSNTTNLVKIIRKQSIGSIVYNTNANGFSATWGSNTLYKILNEYYYGALKTTNYCTSNLTGSSRICDYRYNGIKSDGYYGKMIKNVYWNTLASLNGTYGLSAVNFYTNEIKTRTIQGYVGLMSISDYGFAADSSYHSTQVNAYTTEEITNSNWLYGQGYEVVLADSLSILYDGSLNGGGFHSVRPVIYLDPSVFIINGNGTESNPYVIGM